LLLALCSPLLVTTVSNVKIGIQTRSLKQPLKQALQTAARLGAEGVEIDARTELPPSELSQTGLRQFLKLLDDLRLRVSAVTFPTRRGYGDPNDLDRRVAATQAAQRFAASLGAEVVVNRVGRLPDDEQAASFRQLVEALTAIGVYGERIGVRFAAQSGSEGPQQLARLIAAMPEQTVGIDLHPAALIAAGHSPREAVETLGPHVLHVHACDAVRDLGAGRAASVELGRGTADLPELLGRLTEFNYRGWVTIEGRDSADPAAEIENAVAYLRSL
jgi:sugar phosphate isomerase/epimerase